MHVNLCQMQDQAVILLEVFRTGCSLVSGVAIAPDNHSNVCGGHVLYFVTAGEKSLAHICKND